MPQLCSGLKICVTAGICPTWAKLQLPRLKSTLVLVRNLPKLQLQRLKSTGKKFAQTSASEAEKYGVKKKLPQYFEAGKNYAACVKKKGQSTCVTAIDDSPHTFLLSIFFWNSVETF